MQNHPPNRAIASRWLRLPRVLPERLPPSRPVTFGPLTLDCAFARRPSPLAPRPSPARLRRAAFSLIELLAVMSIIAVMAGLIGYLLRGRGTESYGLQTAQNTIASLLTLARGQAAVSGEIGALFVSTDSDNPERYLRYIVAAVWDPTTKLDPDSEEQGVWHPVSEGVTLPTGCYLLPQDALTSDMVENSSDLALWNSDRSTALREKPEAVHLPPALNGTWVGTVFTPRGTTSLAGNIVLATGRPNPPGTAKPFAFSNPENVRGIKVSVYGQLTFINSRNDL
ncbi:MAG: pilus assembly FimT family protein [Opitutaceae bacterium]